MVKRLEEESPNTPVTEAGLAQNRGQSAEFDARLRLCAFLFAALGSVVTFVYTLLPLDSNPVNEQILRILSLLGIAMLPIVAAFPWKRVAREWFAVATLIILPFVAATVQLSGGWASPFQSFYYLALVFHATYYRRRVTLILNALTLLFSLTPALFNGDIMEFSKHLVVNTTIFLALGLIVDAMVQEVRRQERRIGVLTIERRSNARETARLAALQRAGLLINSRLNAREAMEALVHELSTTLGYPFVTMYLCEEGTTPVLVASAGYSETVTRVPAANSVVERVYRTGVPALMRDMDKTSRHFKAVAGARGMVSVPVHDAGTVVGVLTVEDIQSLDVHDLELLELFAQQADAALTNARRYEEERRRATQEEALRDVALTLTSTLDPAIVLREVLDQLARVLPFDGAAVLTRAGDGFLRIATTRGLFASDETLNGGMDSDGQGIAAVIASTEVAHLLPAYYVHETPERTDGVAAGFPAWIGSLVAAPLLVDATLRGVIFVAATQRGQYGNADADLVADFARHAAVALHNAELHEALARTARTDSLTGLLNHGALLESLAQEVERAERYEHSLSILFFDLDHFKAINDTYGHQFGDEVLRVLARTARETVRHIDTVGRYGGEEFVAILPETDYWKAVTVAERLRERVAAYPFAEMPGGHVVRVTISVGVTAFPGDGRTVKDLIRSADGALYGAKRNGRNRVCGSREQVMVAD